MEVIKKLSLDYESRSDQDIGKSGAYRYWASPASKILLASISVNDGPVITYDLTAGEEIPEGVLRALTDPSVEKWAFNAAFERIKLRGIDRRFVTFHKYSGTTMRVVMELVDQEDEAGAKAFVSAVKRECKNAKRDSRCKIKSPKTGAWICCPDCISCYGEDCPIQQGMSEAVLSWTGQTTV